MWTVSMMGGILIYLSLFRDAISPPRLDLVGRSLYHPYRSRPYRYRRHRRHRYPVIG